MPAMLRDEEQVWDNLWDNLFPARIRLAAQRMQPQAQLHPAPNLQVILGTDSFSTRAFLTSKMQLGNQ